MWWCIGVLGRHFMIEWQWLMHPWIKQRRCWKILKVCSSPPIPPPFPSATCSSSSWFFPYYSCISYDGGGVWVAWQIHLVGIHCLSRENVTIASSDDWRIACLSREDCKMCIKSAHLFVLLSPVLLFLPLLLQPICFSVSQDGCRVDSFGEHFVWKKYVR